LLFLDADDFLLPRFLERTVQVFEDTGEATYTDYEGWAEVSDPSKLARDLRSNIKESRMGITRIGYHAAEFDCERAQRQPEGTSPYLWCDICTVHPKLWYNEIGGFDEGLPSWEDVDYWWRLARRGHCFRRIAEEGFVYRFFTGKRRQSGLENWPNLLQTLNKKYSEESAMGCGGCGKNRTSVPSNSAARVTPNKTMNAPAAFSDGDIVLIEYMHPNIGQHPVYGSTTRHFYGYRSRGEQFLVHTSDIKARPSVFVIVAKTETVAPPTPVPPPPKPVEVLPDGTMTVTPHRSGGVADGAIAAMQNEIASMVAVTDPKPLPEGYESVIQEGHRRARERKAAKAAAAVKP
jgi:hypothetical protein